ncbi:hypothetical protein HY375_03210 [Candidatus Berkelbacteria bacterium]|nr:hypothetical protein [Candidatus Berkelbacteria bacterium]
MTVLVAGGDRTQLRCLIGQDGYWVEATTLQPAQERHDLAILTAFLAEQSLTWADIDQFGLIEVPHSHTSVRVVRALLTTAAWYSGHPLVSLPSPELATLTSSEIQAQLKQP